MNSENSILNDNPSPNHGTIEDLRKAAEGGDADAQFILGVNYDYGEDVPQDY